MLLNNDICNAFFCQQYLQQYILLAKGHFLVSDTAFRRISNASNSYFGLSSMTELDVSIQPSGNFVLIGNQLCFVSHNHDMSLACYIIDSIRIQLF